VKTPWNPYQNKIEPNFNQPNIKAKHKKIIQLKKKILKKIAARFNKE
jgi:hypothetical protein